MGDKGQKDCYSAFFPMNFTVCWHCMAQMVLIGKFLSKDTITINERMNILYIIIIKNFCSLKKITIKE